MTLQGTAADRNKGDLIFRLRHKRVAQRYAPSAFLCGTPSENPDDPPHGIKPAVTQVRERRAVYR